jgi:hypothetical protein
VGWLHKPHATFTLLHCWTFQPAALIEPVRSLRLHTLRPVDGTHPAGNPLLCKRPSWPQRSVSAALWRQRAGMKTPAANKRFVPTTLYSMQKKVCSTLTAPSWKQLPGGASHPGTARSNGSPRGASIFPAMPSSRQRKSAGVPICPCSIVSEPTPSESGWQ